MEEYEKPCFIMVRASEKALRAMENGEYIAAQNTLIAAQQQAEEAILSYSDSLHE